MVVASTTAETLERALGDIGKSFAIVKRSGRPEVVEDHAARIRFQRRRRAGRDACRRATSKDLGDASFRTDHGLRYALMSGAMANGIGSVEIVEAMGRNGLLGIFGAAGLPLAAVEQAIDRIQRGMGDAIPYGMNLIHSPGEPELEAAVVDLFLRRRVRLVEASAFLNLTLPVVRYRVAGLGRDRVGACCRDQSHHRQGLAGRGRFQVHGSAAGSRISESWSPPARSRPSKRSGRREFRWPTTSRPRPIPGGHTDNQPAIVMLPTMLNLRDTMSERHGYDRPLRVGAAGGISTPWAAAAALAMGAAYLVTGSVNQSCVEAATSDAVRRMLAQAQQSDIAMAPAADMFEMGVKVQVLKRGTLFAMRAAKLYELYRVARQPGPDPRRRAGEHREDDLPRPAGDDLGTDQGLFSSSATRRGSSAANRDPKQKMALVFRWYLGMSSHWANSGEPSRTVDYQIWCGPAMAAFNDWVRGSFLEPPENRRVATVAINILYGAAVLTRARIASVQGVRLPRGVPRLTPLDLTEIENRLFLS